MKQKKVYCAPEVEVMNARVEKGFFLSAGQDANSNGNEQLTNSGNEYLWN
ncbi:MAG: hypothetical protein J5641_05095 [Bacteroidales bacterium]|nr:hypothetical protein [Bacteroidales bacterium]